MVSSDVTGQRCAMVQMYCSEQISIPESFPNILKTYAKAAIRTQPYDVLRWSADYFRCLANNTPPPSKIRLERNCRQGSLTKGYLKALVAQVGKGFFISRCLLQERWKGICLPEDELLKHLSLCRMLNWPQVHWLKILAVMIGSLNKTPYDTMVMLCELLTDDVEGGLARIPYWMFKICYTFVAMLECSQEQCFVNGQKVQPWGDLEEVKPMESLPQVLSATLLKDTIITSCKAKFDNPFSGEYTCLVESPSSTDSRRFMINSQVGDLKGLLDKCEDFYTIMQLLQDAQEKPLNEDDSQGPHYISEQQLKNVEKIEQIVRKKRQEQARKTELAAHEYSQQEAFQMLHEVGPPWTWLHQFTTCARNTTSYNFIDQQSIRSDVTPGATSTNTLDSIKGPPSKMDKDQSCSSSCYQSEFEIEETKCSLESLKSLIEVAKEQRKCHLENTSSIISVLKSEELGVLQRAGESFKPELDLNEVVRILERSDSLGTKFTDVEQLMDHVKTALFANIADFPSPNVYTTEKVRDIGSLSAHIDDVSLPHRDQESIHIPEDSAESSRKQVEKTPSTAAAATDTSPPQELAQPRSKDEMTAIFENTVGIPPEKAAKMPKFCFEKKDEEELILGLVQPSESSEIVEEEEIVSPLPESDLHSGDGYRQDDFEIRAEENEVSKEKISPDNMDYYCCTNAPTLQSTPYEPPPLQFHCTLKPLPGIGPAVSQKTIDDFLAFLRVRSRSQRGFINPRNFKEERCPYMVDNYTTVH